MRFVREPVPSTTVIAIDGQVTDDLITFAAHVTSTSGGNTMHFLVRRNAAADFREVICAAIGA